MAAIKRFQIGFNVVLQVALLVFIIGMVNYLSFNHFKRWDFSRDKKYALSETTKSLLQHLKKPAKIFVFFSPNTEVYGDVVNLLKEVQYGAGKNVEIEYIDPFRNFTRARQLQDKYKFGANENVIIVDYDGRTKFVNASDIVDVDNSGAEYGQPPRVTAFKGEQGLASALLEVSEAAQNNVFYLTGQGEPDLAGDDFSNAKTLIERQNIKLSALNLMNVDAAPKDAKAILVMHAKYDPSEREIKLLRDYWEKKGRVMILLDPASSTPKLAAFLQELGVKPNGDRVLKTVDLGPLGKGVLRQVPGIFMAGSPVTKRLHDANALFLGDTESLTLNTQAVEQAGVHLQPLIQAGEGFWGETNFEGDDIFFDAKRDFAAPLTLAVSVEKGAVNDTSVDSSRMLVVGNSDFLTGEGLTQVNLDFALSGLNWLLDRQELTGISPKVANLFTLNLTEAQTSRMLLIVVIIIPSVAALFGLLVIWRRRH